MDDDLPREGELLDISRKQTASTKSPQVPTSPGKVQKFPVGMIGIFVILLVLGIVSKMFFSHEDPEKIAVYKEATQAVFTSMKSQLPYLTTVTCEGKAQDKPDCINFVGTFIPNKDSQNFLSVMIANDQVSGASASDIALIKDNLKVLIEVKRTTLSSRKPLTFLIVSTTIPKVGEETVLKTRCTEEEGDLITCETER